MKSIAVLYGGRSGEHEVSLISASSILAYLDKDKYSIVPIGITKSENGSSSILQNGLIPGPKMGKCALFLPSKDLNAS